MQAQAAESSCYAGQFCRAFLPVTSDSTDLVEVLWLRLSRDFCGPIMG
jgi:hypothetical protein